MRPDAGEQRAYFRDLDAEHFRWQTAGGYLADTEAALLRSATVGPGERLLEIGCGEGGNLHHLRARGARLFGVDFSLRKAAFAARATGATCLCCDAASLPFRDAAFDAVLVRDLLHHVPDRGAVLAEAARVLRPGGALTVIEPNRWNPLIAAQAAALSAERGMLVSTGPRLLRELTRAGLVDLRLERAQPLPLGRALFHPRHGAAALGRIDAIARALRRLDRALERLPLGLWAYLVAHARRP